jgi:hypothetical protein
LAKRYFPDFKKNKKLFSDDWLHVFIHFSGVAIFTAHTIFISNCDNFMACGGGTNYHFLSKPRK